MTKTYIPLRTFYSETSVPPGLYCCYSDATTLQRMSYKNKHGPLINLARKLTTFREAFPKRSALSGIQTGVVVNTRAFSWQMPGPGELDFGPAFSRWT